MTFPKATVLAALAICSWLHCHGVSGQMEPYIGQISMFAGNFAPRGWAFCDGQLLSIAQNTALFSILGTTYGGNGQTTFALPDLRGRAPMHAGGGAGPGLTHRVLGEASGTERVTLAINEMPAHSDAPAPHTHSVTLPNTNMPHQHSATLPPVPAHTHDVVLNGAASSSHNHTVQLTANSTTHSHDATIPAWAASHTHTADSHTHTVAVNQITFSKQTLYISEHMVSDRKHHDFTTPITIYTPTTKSATATTSSASVKITATEVSQPATPITTKAASALANGDLTLTTSSAMSSISGLSASTTPGGAQAGATVRTTSSTWDWVQGTNQVTSGPAVGGAGTVVGGNQAHNNMPPYLAINFIIALEGIYPSRN